MDEAIKMILDKLDGLGKKLDRLETRMDGLEMRMDRLETKVDSLETRMDGLETKVNDIQLTLENETNRNIQIVAEGHANLNRKLDEALTVESEKEMLLLRVNRMENELRRLKEQISEIA